MFEAFFAFVNCIKNTNKIECKKIREASVSFLVCFVLREQEWNIIRIEIARVRGLNKDGRDVFLAVS